MKTAKTSQFISVILWALLLLPSLLAQTSRGTFTGTVTDASRAAVPGAAVEIKNQQTGVTRSTQTNQIGIYRLDAVDLGTYDVSVTASGFRAYASKSVPVEAAQISTVNAILEIGEAASTVEVTSDSIQLQTETAVRGGNISRGQFVFLPLIGRNPNMLAITLPGVTEQRADLPGSSTFSVNGSRGRSNNFLLDGTENNDISIGGQGFQIKNPDTVQEVSVQTSNYDVEFGRAGGAVVNTITKSGTNNFHGTLGWVADFSNDDAITNTLSIDPTIQQRGKLPPGYEQYYNGTLGGAIVKNRTFFFTSWQEQRLRATGTTSLVTLSPLGREQLRNAFPTGTNPRADLYLDITKGVDASGQFTNLDLGSGRGNAQFGTAILAYPRQVVSRQSLNKIDHVFRERDLMSVRYAFDRTVNPTASTNFPGFFTSEQQHYHNVVLTETHIFSPTLTNELRIPYNRIEFSYPNDATSPLAQTLPAIQITGLASLGVSSSYPQGRIANNFILQDTMSWVRGRHTVRFGIDLLQQRSRQIAPAFTRGLVAYGASTFQGQSFSQFANFLDDYAGAGGVSRDFGNPTFYPELFRQAYFAQDKWQIRQNFTVTFGLRWEDFGTPVNSLRTPVYTGLFNVNVDPVNHTFTAPMTEPNRTNQDLNNFSPALGITYSPRFKSGMLGKLLGDGRTVLRTGYNIGYDSFFNNLASNAATSSPNLVSTSTASSLSEAAPRGLANASSILPTVPRAVLPIDAQSLVIKDLRNPYYQHWSFGIQRELPGGVVVDASYVGSSGTRLYIQEDFNPSIVNPALRVLPAGFTSLTQLQAALPAGYTLQTRYDPLQGSRSIRTNGGHSSYHSGQFELSKRFSSDLGVKVAYTVSKTLDNGSDVFLYNNSTPNAAVPSIFGGNNLEKGPSLYDRPYRLVISYNYLLPFLKAQRGLVGHIVGGWQVAGVTTFESGVPYTVTNGLDSDGLGGATERPMYNPAGQAGVRARIVAPGSYVNPDVLGANGQPVPIDPSQARYIGLPAYVVGSVPQVGDAPRNSERTPGINNFNVNLLKNIRITEGFLLEFRTEFYNIFNHTQYGYPSVSPFTPAGGTPFSNLNGSLGGRFLNNAILDGGGRTIRYQLTLRF